MIITLSSVAGAPGVSSLTMLLAAGWPAEYTAPGFGSGSPIRMGRVALECDLDGGVYGARYGIGVEPGAATLVSRTRHSVQGAHDVDLFGRPVGDQAWVVPGPESAEGARQLWSGAGVAESVAASLAQDDRVWFVDIGRANSSSPVAPLLDHASLSLLVTRADHESVVQVPRRVADLRSRSRAVGVIVVGKPAFSLGELSEFFDTSLLWTVPSGEDIVALSRSVWSSKKVRRSLTWRAALEISHDVAERVAFRSDATVDPAAGRSDDRSNDHAADSTTQQPDGSTTQHAVDRTTDQTGTSAAGHLDDASNARYPGARRSGDPETRRGGDPAAQRTTRHDTTQPSEYADGR